MKIEVGVKERAFLVLDGKPSRYLEPGVHSVFAPFAKVTVEKLSTTELVPSLDAERLALVPANDLTVVSVGELQRAVVRRANVPVKLLKPGVHQVLTVDRTVDRKTGEKTNLVTVALLDVSGTTTRPLADELKALMASTDYVEVTVPEGAVALEYVDGVLSATRGPGRHAAFTVEKKVSFAVIDLKERLLHVTGQEVMTKDRVSLRLNVSAVFKVADAARLASVARNADDVLYLAMQLAARDAVSSRTLDELLAARGELATSMAAAVTERATSVGLTLLELGLKDVVLPGEMKELLNKVIAAQKAAEANVISRREETAATRSLAQTAKVLAENPLLVRLKELEAYSELAGKVGQVNLVLGDGALSKLKLELPSK